MAGIGAKVAVRLDRHITYELVGYIVSVSYLTYWAGQ